MGKATVLTPVYFFCSVRAGSGKSSTIANMAIHANSLRQKVAIIDLASEAPQKLKSSFPSSVKLQEYSDILQISASVDSRYQKAFYFTDTDLISLFPAHSAKDPSVLFQDTGLRDFLIQLKSCFDLILINYPAGCENFDYLSQTLKLSYLWRGMKAAAAIFLASDERSIVALDQAVQKNIELSHQLEDNILLQFCKVPASPEEQNLSDTVLNSIEVKSIFSFPNILIATNNEEHFMQRTLPHPLVLDTDSTMYQSISTLSRALSRLGTESSQEINEFKNNYAAVLDGAFLEKLSPFIRQMQKKVAARLFLHPSQIQVFLEENDQSFRIRVRTSGLYHPLLPVSGSIPVSNSGKTVLRESPASFAFQNKTPFSDARILRERVFAPQLSSRPIFNFDDRFAWKTNFTINQCRDFFIEKDSQPSPILFKASHRIAEIPSLAEVLGYGARKYKTFSFSCPEQLTAISGVTHFFIPPEFDLINYFTCKDRESFRTELKTTNRSRISHQKEFTPSYRLVDAEINIFVRIPDLFARTYPFKSEYDYSLRLPRQFEDEMCMCPTPSYSSSYKGFGNFEIDFCGDNRVQLSLLQKIESKNLPIDLFSRRPRNIYPANPASSFYTQSCCPKDFKIINSNNDISFLEKSEGPPELTTPNYVARPVAEIFKLVAELNLSIAPLSSPLIPGSQPPLQVAFELPQIDFLNKTAFKAPRNFSSEIILIEHKFLNWKPRSIDERTFFYQTFSARKPELSPQTFFSQNFILKEFVSIPQALLFQKHLEEQIFRVTISGFRPLVFNAPMQKRTSRWDILATRNFSHHDRNYKSSSTLKYYKTDNLLDSRLSERSLSLSKRNMLNLNQNTQNLTAGHIQLINYSDFDIDSPQLPDVDYNLEAARLNFKEQQREPKGLKIDHATAEAGKLFSFSDAPFRANLPAKVNAPHFYQTQTVEIYTVPIRTPFSRLSIFDQLKEPVLIDISPELITGKFALQEPKVKNHSCSFSHLNLTIPPVLPLRSKVVETPQFSTMLLRGNFVLPQLKKLKIKNTHSSSYLKLSRNHFKGFKVDFLPLQIKPSVFYNSNSEPFYSFSPSPVSFNLDAIDPVNELFENLLFNIRAERACIFDFEISTQTLPLVNREPDAKSNSISLPQCSLKINPIRPPRMVRPGYSRNFLILTKSRFRDLKNLARQAVQKFSKYEQNV